MRNLILDTSIIIDFLRRKDKVNTLFIKLINSGYKLHISIITHTELYAGKSVWESKKAKEELKLIFSGLRILSLEKNISSQAGHIKAVYKVDLFDAIIAATTMIHGMELITLNIKDFQKIKELKLFTE